MTTETTETGTNEQVIVEETIPSSKLADMLRVIVEETIPASKLADILRLKDKDRRAILRLSKEAKIRIVENCDDPLISRKDVQDFLGIVSLPEKFLTIKEVADMFKSETNRVKYLCDSGLLPFYKIRKEQGSKLLFIEEEVLKYKELLSVSDFSMVDYYPKGGITLWKMEKYERIISSLLGSIYVDNKTKRIRERNYAILNGMLLHEKTTDATAEQFKLSTESVRQIFEKGFASLLKYTEKIPDYYRRNKELEEKVEVLKKEILVLKASNNPETFKLTKDQQNFLQTKIQHTDLSARVCNWLGHAEIFTIGDLIKHTEKDLLKIRNFGEKCLTEVKEFLAKYNLRLKEDEREEA